LRHSVGLGAAVESLIRVELELCRKSYLEHRSSRGVNAKCQRDLVD